MGVKEYEKWTLAKSVEEIDKYNAQNINDKEIELIRSVNPQKILDIGCRNGKRLFSYLDEQGIDYVGIEKFEKLVEFGQNKYSDKIIVTDILDVNFKKTNPQLVGVDMITILGGSLCGVFGYENNYKAWSIMHGILVDSGTIIFEAKMVDKFDVSEKIGEIVFNHKLPPQFYLSEKELCNIWEGLNLKVIKHYDYNIQGWYDARYYVLKKMI